MSTFAVNASDETIAKLTGIMDIFAQEGEKKADTLQRIFAIASKHVDGETMQAGGVDVAALDASLENIRAMFVAAVSGREQILENCNARIAEIRDRKDRLEADLQAKITAAEEARAQAEKKEKAAAQAEAQALKEAEAAKKAAETNAALAETNAALAAEKDRTILTLTKKQDADAPIASLTAQIKAQKENYERIIADEKKASERALNDARKDAETQVRELQAQMDRAVSDVQKDAALAQEKAVADAVREIRDKAQEDLRTADRENARLQAKVELLTEQIAALQSQIQELQEPKRGTRKSGQD